MTHVGVEMALEITKEITLRVKHGAIYIYMCVHACVQRLKRKYNVYLHTAYCILIYMHLYQYLFICSRARK